MKIILSPHPTDEFIIDIRNEINDLWGCIMIDFFEGEIYQDLKNGKKIVVNIEKEITMLNDDSPMPFGAHQGTPMGKVPAKYLDHIIGKDWIGNYPEVEEYIMRNKKVIDMELDSEEFEK